MNHSEIAVKKFNEGYNCAQAVVFSFADKLGEAGAAAFRAANGFGAGMGRKQSVCGAVTGGIMVLGLLYGRDEGDGREIQDAAYAKVRTLIDTFEKRHSVIECGQLLDGCVLLTPEGQAMFREKNMIERCATFVRDVAEIVDDVIAKAGANHR